MNVAVFGLGYVGITSAACLCKMGHSVIGVDVNPLKLDMLGSGRSPVIEDGLDELVSTAVDQGRLSVTADPDEAIRRTELSLVCVGTPSSATGSISLDHVRTVAAQIGDAIEKRLEYHVVVVRSTVLPGTVETEVLPLLEERSGKRAGREFGLCMNPEFLREGSTVDDFFHPPKIVIGEYDRPSGDVVEQLYREIDSPIFRTEIRVAETIKYADNAFHALKVCFANEIGRICKSIACDSRDVMDVLCADTKLNISSCYLRPGFAFGGSCLPKDMRAFTQFSQGQDVATPMLGSVLASNRCHLEHVERYLEGCGKKKIGIIGLSFKSGTDDLRESPIVALAEFLIGKGCSVQIYDEYVSIARLIGANREYIEKEIPHISSLLTDDIGRLVSEAELVIVAKKEGNCLELMDRYGDEKVWVDLAGAMQSPVSDRENYWGICW